MSDGLRLLSAAIAVGATHVVTGLDRELFNDGPEQEAYDFIRGHARSYRELPQVATVRTETGITMPSAPESIAYYEDVVYQRHEYNQIRDQYAPLREALSERDMEQTATIVNSMAGIVRGRRRRGQEVMNIQEAGAAVMARLAESRGYGGISGITSGWQGLDDITGGYQDSDIVSWVGRPGLGKTYLLLKQIYKMHQDGENVLFVTTEMGQEQIARRWASIALGINPTVLKRNMISTNLERRLRGLYESVIGAERLNIFSVGMNASTTAVEAHMQELAPSIVVIDGVYLLKPREMSKSASKVDRVSGVYDDLKGINLDAGVPMLLSTQLNRASGKGGKDASLENLSFADAIGTHSSIVIAAKPGPTPNPMDSREMEFLKGREGESGSVAINFKFAPLNMDQIPVEELLAMADGTSDAGSGGAGLDWMG